MNKTALEILGRHDSYVDALKEAIDRWEKAQDIMEKRDYIAAIGEIGHDIHSMNKTLDIK
jgi:Tat protein secretion system quality control protein TatD with DNase activity